MSEAALVVGVGALDGVGAAAARRFAKQGLHAFVVGRTAERLQQVAAEIARDGGAATAIVADATESADVVRVFDAAEHGVGRPPSLVLYNAGNNFPKDLLETTDQEFEASWRVCGFGAFLYAREAARRMVPAGGGTVLFTGATASLRSKPPFVAFAAAKAAERAVAQGLARQFGPDGLHVAHVILDGVIEGDQVRSRYPALLDRMGPEGTLSIEAIADAMWMLHTQDRRAWTHELDLRPHRETF